MILIIEDVKRLCKLKAKIRIAFIGYRDIGDRERDFEHMELIDFTTLHYEVKYKIFQSRGLDLSYQADTLFVYLICDAPCHGK